MKLSICILAFNKFNFTKSCLKDLSQLPNDHEIIVVDNGSSDETKSLEGSSEIIYHRLSENKGFSHGCNVAYSMSTASNVLFLNNDIRVKSNHNDWTKVLIDSCDYGLIGPTMGQLDKDLNFIQEANKILGGNSYMSGWCLASSKENWEKLKIGSQIFSEEFFCYFEDTDLSFRAKKLGIKMKVVDIPVVHFGKQSSSQLNVRQLYLDARKIFIKKWK